jgi:enoyl-CoA hydratase/carnithine racemase
MLLTGRLITAQEAFEFGLINRVTSKNKLEAITQELIDPILQSSPLTVHLGKQAFYNQIDMTEEQAYAYAINTIALNLDTHDAQEGISAFLEKRTPKWKGF